MAGNDMRERRAESRAKRRGQAPPEPPTPEQRDVIDDTGSGDVLRTAASAAVAGVAAGAVEAIARRRHHESEDEPTDSAGRVETDEPAAPETESAHLGVPAGDDDGAEEHHVDERVEHDERPPQRAAPGEAGRMIDRAREQLRELRGTEIDSVSSVKQTRGGWRVTLEVVEVHRIPDSTDVLASYEVDLDDDGNLVTFERAARYYRSEAERR